MVPLSRAIGRKRALEILLTGQPITAETALDWGLVNRIVPVGALEDEHRAYDLTKAVMAMNARADDA
jgi:enoyl-CoA hydratase/carnithine racemase